MFWVLKRTDSFEYLQQSEIRKFIYNFALTWRPGMPLNWLETEVGVTYSTGRMLIHCTVGNFARFFVVC